MTKTLGCQFLREWRLISPKESASAEMLAEAPTNEVCIDTGKVNLRAVTFLIYFRSTIYAKSAIGYDSL